MPSNIGPGKFRSTIDFDGETQQALVTMAERAGMSRTAVLAVLVRTAAGLPTAAFDYSAEGLTPPTAPTVIEQPDQSRVLLGVTIRRDTKAALVAFCTASSKIMSRVVNRALDDFLKVQRPAPLLDPPANPAPAGERPPTRNPLE